jgi:hypothetical protein
MLALVAGVAAAQSREPGLPTGDVPAGPAAIRGRVVHPERPEAAANVDVVLYALPPSGTPGVRRAVTDASGAFAFEGIGNDPAIAYLVGARYGDVPFPGERVSFEAGETERTIEVRIADATQDAKAVEVREGTLTLERTADGLRVTEAWRLANHGHDVVYVAPADRARVRPAFATTLPAGATTPTHPLGMKPEGVVQQGDVLRFYGPVYPGEQELSYSYDVPHRPGSLALAKSLTTGARVLRVRAPEELGALRAQGFAPATPESVAGRSLRVLEAKDLAAGRRVGIELDLAPLESDPGLLSVEEVAVQVELDEEAMLFAHERWTLQVAGNAPLAGTTDAPLLHLALPPGADDLRLPPDAQRLGLAADPKGGLAVVGPLPPGESNVEFLYRRPLSGGPVDLSLRFERPTPLLSVYVSDTGLVADSERLHRRRPVRSEDGAFLLHLEAFDVEAGETVPLRLTPLPPSTGTAHRFVIVGVLVAAAGAVWLLVAPLARRERGADEWEQELPELRRERESLYTAMRDLDDDHETGKIDDADWQTMRDDLRARALALLEAERTAAPVAPPGARAPAAPVRAFCSACGAAIRPDDRFCAQCGTRLAPGARADREAASA